MKLFGSLIRRKDWTRENQSNVWGKRGTCMGKKKMKKAGILSMQRIYNYGSFLQAYALKKMMEECGAEVEFVDYHPGECILPSKETTGMKRKIQKGLEILRMKGRLRDKIQFVKYKKNYARKNYPVLGLKETCSEAGSAGDRK